MHQNIIWLVSPLPGTMDIFDTNIWIQRYVGSEFVGGIIASDLKFLMTCLLLRKGAAHGDSLLSRVGDEHLRKVYIHLYQLPKIFNKYQMMGYGWGGGGGGGSSQFRDAALSVWKFQLYRKDGLMTALSLGREYRCLERRPLYLNGGCLRANTDNLFNKLIALMSRDEIYTYI